MYDSRLSTHSVAENHSHPQEIVRDTISVSFNVQTVGKSFTSPSDRCTLKSWLALVSNPTPRILFIFSASDPSISLQSE